MKKLSHIIKNTRFLIFVKSGIILLILLSACKKEDDILDEELPVFGTCGPVNPKENLTISGSTNGIFTYTTSTGGKIVIDTENRHSYTFTHADYSNFSIQFWGDVLINNEVFMGGGHENLNGKHVKDIDISVTHRSLIFPDGTKFTLLFENSHARARSATIYEGNQCHHINFYCNTLEYSEANSSFAQQIDNNEVDGETGTFEFTETGLLYLNIYTEDIAGQKVEKRIPIGEIFRDQPNVVNDYY